MCLIWAIYLAAVTLNMPMFFMTEIILYEVQYTEWGLSSGSMVYRIIRMMLVKIIPICVIFICSGLSVYAIRQFRKSKAVANQTEHVKKLRLQAQMRLTIMAVFISIVTLVCHVLEPFLDTHLFKLIAGDCSVMESMYVSLVLAVYVLESVSYASNFFIFCAFNKQFVQYVKKLCQCRRRHTNAVAPTDNTD